MAEKTAVREEAMDGMLMTECLDNVTDDEEL